MKSIVIVVSDSFRETAVDQLLPILIRSLLNGGASDEAIRFLFSTGTHRGPTPVEQEAILGSEVFSRYTGRITVHDARDDSRLVYIGDTIRGTRVEVNRLLVEADAVIATGTVVLHYFGGYGGGRKSIVPGLASARTIACNHSLNLHPSEDRLDPAVSIGRLEGNPVAEDMLEAAQMVRVDAIVNTVLNGEGEIAGLFAGDMLDAHANACAFARSLYGVNVEEKADLVLAASPFTKNFVQTHKALYNAYSVLRPEGRIVLLAPCEEGLGSESFVKWIRMGSRSAIIAGLRKESDINGQTALSTCEKAPCVRMVSSLSPDEIGMLGAQKVLGFQEGVDGALADLQAQGTTSPRVYRMPSAAYTAPLLMEG